MCFGSHRHSVFLLLIISEIYIEFIAVNFFEQLEFMVHYNASALNNINFSLKSGTLHPVLGFSGNRTVSGILVLSIYWWLRAFNVDLKYKYHNSIMVFFAILFTFSGTVVLLYFLFYFINLNKINKVFFIATFGLLMIAIDSSNNWFGKISLDYFIFIVKYKTDQIMQFLTYFESNPGLIFYGAPSFVSSDFGFIKIIGDTGLFTILLYVYFLKIILKYVKKIFSGASLRYSFFRIFSFFIGMFHYSPFFSVTGQLSLSLFLSIVMFRARSS